MASITTDDLYLFNEGNHYHVHDKLGAHLTKRDGETGVHFAVWAPNAARVSVVGGFNGWNPQHTPLERMGESGVWSGFVAGVVPGGRLVVRRFLPRHQR